MTCIPADEVPALLDDLASVIDDCPGLPFVRELPPADIVRRAAHLLRSWRGNLAKEEREAWDGYVAGALACPDVSETQAAQAADFALAERRKRFGGGT